MDNRNFGKGERGGEKRSFPLRVNYNVRTDDEKRILETLKRNVREGFRAKELLRESRIQSREKFYSALDILKAKGDVIVDDRHNVRLFRDEDGVPATLVSLSRGFGFARPEEGGDDVFVHISEMRGAYLGDKLILGNVRRDDRGLSGKVMKIKERSGAPVTGTMRIDSEGAHVTPDGPVRYDMEVLPENVNGAKDRDKVLIEPMTDRRGEWKLAKVKAVFGSADRARICADAIIERYGIPTKFPEDVMRQAADIAKMAVTEEDMQGRLDLRDEPIFTIDSADAKDLDDAVCAYKTENGYRLGVHIADVSHYVREGTPIDKEAFQRGTSVYFADRVVPMLPEALSNGLCSLNAGTEKLTFSAIMDFDSEGIMTGWQFRKSVINSKVRGVYKEVNAIFDGTADSGLRDKYEPVAESLKAAKELADILERNAFARGQMELSSDEMKFILDENGVCVDIVPRSVGESEQMIEQLMVAANNAAAKESMRLEIPFLYRVHDKPQPERVAELCELLDLLTVPCTELKKGNPAAADFSAVLKRVKGTQKEMLVAQRILRTMEKAKYSEKETGHFGLALDEYSHFTSPIRRYPDTSIHRILTAVLSGMPKKTVVARYSEFARESALESSKNEIRAVSGERSAEDCYVAEYLKQHIGEKHAGVISGATPKGVFVRIENGAEGFVPLDAFEGCDFVFDGMITHRDQRSGRTMRVGDELGIVVASADVASGRVDFVPDAAE